MGIAPGGKTLLELLEESEKLYRDTGFYWGLERLELYERDPLRWERERAQLKAIMVLSRESATRIAASPITRSIGETCWVLYTPEGDSVVLSTGIIVHVHTMSEEIKWIIRRGYEENPGIMDGDHFIGNDPALGNVHTTDVHTITPVFYKGTLISWIGSVTHQVDIGANTPGHDICTSSSRFEDGLYMECELVMRNGKLFPHYYERSRRGVRTPLYFDLDEKARFAGNEMAKRMILEFVEKVGVDYYLQLIKEIIEKSRRDYLARTKERLIPGRYRTLTLSETPFIAEAWQPHARDDWLHPLPMEITITRDGRWVVDIEGSTGTGPWPWNGAISPFMGGFWVVMTQILGYSETINEGFVKAIDFRIPEKSWVGDPNPYISRNVPWYFLIPQMQAIYRCVAMGAFARGIIEEGASGYGMTADPVQGGGITTGKTGHPPGIYYPISTFEIAGQGLGANAVRDGLDYGYAMWNPEADIGDVEEWERIQLGFIYLARKIRANSAGYGERRGGSGYAHVAIFFGSSNNVVQNLNMGKAFTNTGLYGGYPSPTAYTLIARGVNLEELIRQRLPYPLSDDPDNPEFEKLLSGLCKGIERLDYGTHFPRQLEEGDFYYFKQNGGPGYGDPLDRPLELCEKDLNDGVYTAEIMEKVYGVIAKFDDDKGIWIVDREASEKLRKEKINERLKKAKDFAQFYIEERERILISSFIRPVAKMYQEQREISPDFWNEFLEFWQLPQDYIPEVEELEEYRERVLRKHEELIKHYREFLEKKGYDLSKIRHLSLRERW
ncbi:MAG: hydantoinase B/oxoprolinase family protein [Archaeoglobaceae archaeon]